MKHPHPVIAQPQTTVPAGLKDTELQQPSWSWNSTRWLTRVTIEWWPQKHCRQKWQELFLPLTSAALVLFWTHHWLSPPGHLAAEGQLRDSKEKSREAPWGPREGLGWVHGKQPAPQVHCIFSHESLIIIISGVIPKPFQSRSLHL